MFTLLGKHNQNMTNNLCEIGWGLKDGIENLLLLNYPGKLLVKLVFDTGKLSINLQVLN